MRTALVPQRRRVKRCVLPAAALAFLGATSALAPSPPAQAQAQPAPDPSTVELKTGGAVQGKVFSNSYREFDGIQYGDSGRWQKSYLVHLSGTNQATSFGPQCPQLPLGGARGSNGGSQTSDAGTAPNEHCLYLNVATPLSNGVPPSKLPVMVYIHGGAFTTGTGASYLGSAYPFFPAPLVASGNVILVTINYRLGALGFLDDPELDANLHGEWGLGDQQLALRWVQDNIDRFGGDPTNVTIFGQSAGAASVCAQLAAPDSAGLFQKAIIESGACALPFPTGAASLATSRDLAFVTALQQPLGPCAKGDVACLRGLPLDQILGEQQAVVAAAPPLDRTTFAIMPFAPTAGGSILPQQPGQALASGEGLNRVPLLLGSTWNEGRFFWSGKVDVSTQANYESAFEAVFPNSYQQILAQYPYPGDTTDAYESYYQALTDWGGLLGGCPELMTAWVASLRTTVYAYEFRDPNSPLDSTLNLLLDIGLFFPQLGSPPPPPFPLGAMHGAEVPYWGGLMGMGFNVPLNTAEGALSKSIISYWASFAATGVPSDTSSTRPVPWLPFDAQQSMLQLDSSSGRSIANVTDFGANHKCSFWLSGVAH